jgi:beta-barrel assembly-enhancing protease
MIRARTIREEFFLLAMLVAVTLGISYGLVHFAKLPIIKASRGINDIPLAWEMKVGDAVYKYLQNDSKLVEIPEIKAVMRHVTDRLAARVRDTAFNNVRVLVVESGVTNAVTFPGGLVVVFTPLFRLTDSPEELAAVIAHEFGHVEHRDPLKQYIRQMGISVVLSMASGNKAPSMVEDLVKEFINVRYTREQESSADSFAVKLLADARIDPIAFATFMQKLAPDSSSETSLDHGMEYFSTHPDIHERISLAQKASQNFDKKSRVPFRYNWRSVKKSLPSIFE